MVLGGRRPRGRVLRLSASGGATLLSLLRLAQPVALALDHDEFGAMDQAVDERDDAGGAGEHRGPLCEGLVGREDDRLVLLVPAGDDLEEQVSVPRVVGEVADLVDAEDGGLDVGPEASRASRLSRAGLELELVKILGEVAPIVGAAGSAPVA